MKILIADDHPLVRDALARTVTALDDTVEVLEAAGFDEARRHAAAQRPDLALVDLNMPGMHGVDGLKALRREFEMLPLIVASGQDDAATIRAVLATGACGFIPKSESRDVVLQAIRLVLAGGVYVPPGALCEWASADPAQPLPASARGDVAADALTPRQLDVLRELLHGRPNKLIARELGLTEGTVKTHIAAILRALRARNRTEAVLRAQQLGWLQP